MIERGTVENSESIFNNYIELYGVDAAGLKDVSVTDALAGAGVTPITKRLVLDVNASGVDPVDSIASIN